MLTITVTSIVRDMIESYGSVRDTLTSHYTFEKPNLFEALKEFVLTRECWHYPRNQEPALEVTFSVFRLRQFRARDQGGRCLDLNLHYSSNPPTLGFHGLQNVVSESSEFVLKPTVRSARPFSELCMVDVDYFVGPARDWLEWDPINTCFRGRVPLAIASVAGVQRQDAYTMPLEVTASITKVFPGGIRYENVIRCALPLTVKRRPDDCGSCYGPVSLPSPVKSLLSIPGLELPPPMNVEVRMMRNIRLHSDNQNETEVEPDSKQRPSTPRVSRLRKRTKTPLGPRAPNVGDEPREMGPTHVDKRGDLASDSDDGTPEHTPKAVNIHLSPERPPPSARVGKRRLSSEDVVKDVSSRKKGVSLLSSLQAQASSAKDDVSVQPEDSASESDTQMSPDTVDSLRYLHRCVDKMYTKVGPAEWEEFYQHIERFLPLDFASPSKVPDTSAEQASSSKSNVGKGKEKACGGNDVFWIEHPLRSRTPSPVDSAQVRGSSNRADAEPVDADQWQKEIQRNFQEFKEHKREFSEGLDTKMADAEAWSDSELVLPE
jgi:hypothetical protein